MIKIYTLADPITNCIRYVGKTKDELRIRLAAHRGHEKSPKSRWIAELKLKGERPLIDLLEEVDEADSDEVERFYISYLRFVGCDLLNVQSGGITGYEGQKLQDWHIEKITTYGKAMSNETKAKISEKRKIALPRKFSDETRIKLSKLKIGGDGKRPVAKYDKNWNLIKEYEMVKDAKNEHGVTGAAIRKACALLTDDGKPRTYQGFYWKYID